MERMFLTAEAKRVALTAVMPGWEEMTTCVVFMVEIQTAGRLPSFKARGGTRMCSISNLLPSLTGVLLRLGIAVRTEAGVGFVKVRARLGFDVCAGHAAEFLGFPIVGRFTAP
jgi:hypothetical protein